MSGLCYSEREKKEKERQQEKKERCKEREGENKRDHKKEVSRVCNVLGFTDKVF